MKYLRYALVVIIRNDDGHDLLQVLRSFILKNEYANDLKRIVVMVGLYNLSLPTPFKVVII